MKRLGVVLLTVLVFVAFGLLPDWGPAQAQEEACRICYNNFGQANFFARIGREVAINTIKMLGGEPIATVTSSVEERIKAIENCIAAGGDAIIIQEGDIRQAAPALEEAKKAGLVIASMGAGTSEYNDVTVESNEWVMGAMAASYLMDLLDGEGNIVVIHNPLGEMIRIRRQGLLAVLTEYPNAQIVHEFVYAWPDFFPDIKSKMETVLGAHPKAGSLDAVYATFDGAGCAAAAAIREAGRQDEFVIVGIDGDPMAYKEMSKADSPFKATVAQQPWIMAKTTVQKVFQLLEGDKLAMTHIYIPTKLVIKEDLPPESEWPYPEVYAEYPSTSGELEEGIP